MKTTSKTRIAPLALAAAALAVLALASGGCGSSSSKRPSSAGAASGSSGTQTATTAAPPPALNELPAAQRPIARQFPLAKGRTLQQLANMVAGTDQLGPATGSFTPGVRRFAFGLNTRSGAFVYAPTAIYFARSPSSPAQGPFLAPADPMTVAPQYRSAQNAGPGGIQAIYAAQLPLPHAGTFTLLALTRTPRGLVGAPGEVAVARSSPIPNVGERPPAIATDTTATGGSEALLTTRVPPDDMHAVSFNAVLGKRPVALLFSTPQLCMSKVCGPVTDIAVSLEHQFGNRITFIHQEVYVDNQPTKGLRPQLKAFHLQTEPWLFTVNRQGRIAARLEGAFGVDAFTAAIEAALK